MMLQTIPGETLECPATSVDEFNSAVHLECLSTVHVRFDGMLLDGLGAGAVTVIGSAAGAQFVRCDFRGAVLALNGQFEVSQSDTTHCELHRAPASALADYK